MPPMPIRMFQLPRSLITGTVVPGDVVDDQPGDPEQPDGDERRRDPPAADGALTFFAFAARCLRTFCFASADLRVRDSGTTRSLLRGWGGSVAGRCRPGRPASARDLVLEPLAQLLVGLQATRRSGCRGHAR